MAFFDRWDIVEAHYFWNKHHYMGMDSRYEKMCKIQKYFQPSILQDDEPRTENAKEIYNDLCEKNQCSHDDDFDFEEGVVFSPE